MVYIIIPVVEHCIRSRDSAGKGKRTHGGTLKCRRVNFLGHERMYRAYEETYGYHMYEQSFHHLR